AGTSWGLSWSYDGFGNRLSQTVTQGTGPSSVTLVNGNTNRISSAGYAYDSNGNMTQMPKGSGSMTLDYDLSNRVSGVSHPDGTEQYRYAPDNRRVWRSAGRTACYASRDNTGLGYWSGSGEGATEQVILYSPGGQKMGAYCLSFSANLQYFAVTASEENVLYGGRVVGKRLVSVTNSNNGLVSDFTADRLQSKGNGSNYYPYGESKTSTAGDDREGFATYTRDEKSGLDYADQRWYASGVGRFTSVDPFRGSTNLALPATWNKYSYVEGSPAQYFDPLGLCKVDGTEYPDGSSKCPDKTSVTVTDSPKEFPFVHPLVFFMAASLKFDWPAISLEPTRNLEAEHAKCQRESSALVEQHKKLWSSEFNKRVTDELLGAGPEEMAKYLYKVLKEHPETMAIAATMGSTLLAALVTIELALAETVLIEGLIAQPYLDYMYDLFVYEPSKQQVASMCSTDFAATPPIQ
ncbi:MAG: RHS repeat-associated core domain-containing protein, partial [Acidobacteria bacterium]|nr:RHS repeat-associated core domain-containing protein [Acidobacteriota bacterium]